MSTTISPLAGKPAPASLLVDTSTLIAAFTDRRPDPEDPAQRVAFGTSGHRGSALRGTFNEWHVAAVTQAVCDYRRRQGIDGPLFLGRDTHALSEPAFYTALEVLAGNRVEVMIAGDSTYTPTPAISHAILTHNRERKQGTADGIVITPSHNPPDSGGIKYNPPNGGPAATAVSGWIEQQANRLLAASLNDVVRLPQQRALAAATTHEYPYLGAYVGALDQVIDMAAIADAGVRLGVDPLGGAGVEYWGAIQARYRLNLEVISDVVDPAFAFMSVDWDGKIRMDPSSEYAMQSLIALSDQFDVTAACDTDHDRHGIVTPSAGLMPANHYLAVMASYLFRHRPGWPASAALGKTVVTSGLLNRIAASLDRHLVEVPVGFKWYVDGLLNGSLGFAGEESAGASFVRFDGTPWSTDKDGIIAVLLAAEMVARTETDPGDAYRTLTDTLGAPAYRRVDAPASAEQKSLLSSLTPADIGVRELAGEPIESVTDRAPGNGEPIGGLKVTARNGWFAVRPSGTEDLYKLYAESFLGDEHLNRLVDEAQSIVEGVESTRASGLGTNAAGPP